MKLLFIAIINLVIVKSYAFTLNNNINLAFDKDNVKVNLASGFCTNIGRTDEEMLTVIEDAVNEYWNRSPTSRIKLQKGSAVSVSNNFKTGLICTGSGSSCDANTALAVSSDILISCNTNATNFSNSTSVLAVTIPNNTENTAIKGSLVILNDTTPNNKIATKSRDELVAVIAHELGHAIGLGHSPVINSLMYYAVIPNRRSLGQDDVDGVTYLYPKQQPVSCGTIEDISKDKSNKLPSFLIGIFLGLMMAMLSYYFLKLRPRLAHSAS